ncbi:unnamed protein product [Mytilus edulis]|uniref:TRIM2_3 n=1 Tax=Mytilus edulis TaxID=6550 RepID=A0A8S3S5W6_MYTED|nr:unnamed protein product [Mytilus edulis]
MEQRASQINQIHSQFTKMTLFATELQIYIGLREIEKTTSQTAKYIEDLESGNNFIEKSLELNISSALQSFYKTSNPLEISLSIPPLLPSEKGRKDGIFIRIVVTSTKDPFDVCFVINNKVAVTLGPANQTTLVDIENDEIIQTIKLSHDCFGVVSDGETFVISSGDRKCTTVNLNDMSHTILEGIEGVGCISLFKGNIYGTKDLESKVFCFKSTGEPLWTFKHQNIDWPVGITLDINGFIYVASCRNNRVVVVSPDGKTCKTILSEAGAIKSPIVIDINKETGMMIVSSKIREDSNTEYETAFVYKN